MLCMMFMLVGCVKMFYKYDYRMLTILLNIYEHLKENWDYLLVVVGDTGTGKSMFCLHLLEEWYRFVLKQSVSDDLAVQMASDYRVWLKNFKSLGEYDMNIYDEGATTLDSKAHMTKLSRDLSKLFNVFRAKKFFSVIVLPSFFDLNKYFREKRLRGLVWVDKRGHYKFYTRVGIDYLNAYNERAVIKSMYRAGAFHESVFPDYKGVLLKPYLEAKENTMRGVLDEVIESGTKRVEKPETAVQVFYEPVAKLLKKGYTQIKIREELGIGSKTITQIRMKLIKEGVIKL